MGADWPVAKVLRKPISDDQFTLLYELDTLQISDNICTGFVIKYLNISN